jgi:general secretion pathway protein D
MKSSMPVIVTVLALSVSPTAPAQIASVSGSAVAVTDRGVPLGQLVDAVAKRSGKKLLLDPRVQENLPVRVYGQEISRVDYDELLAILHLHGFTAFEEGGYVHVIPSAEIRQRAIPVVTASENLPLAQYVTTVIRVKSVSAVFLVPLLRPMVPQEGHLAALPCRNSLIMVDTLANVRRMKAVIDSLDTGEPLSPEKCDGNVVRATPPVGRDGPVSREPAEGAR